MISEFLMKGIDSLFSKGLAPAPIDTHNKPFTKQTIKANLLTVVKEGPKQNKIISQDNDA